MDKGGRARYARHIFLKEVGGQGQQKLLAARVLIVGAGGIGAPVIQYLTAAGVGAIGLADDDHVDLSNLQRQVIFRTQDVGALKTTAAKGFAARLNPDVNIVEHNIRITSANADDIIAGYDLIIEGVDNFETRFALNAAALAANKPLISVAVGRFEAQLSTFKPYAAPGVLPCYRCYVPEAPPRETQFNCAEEGILGAVTGVAGTLAAMEALKELLSLGDSLAGRIMLYDGLTGASRTIALKADPSCPTCGKTRT